jgi:hypothetical protein
MVFLGTLGRECQHTVSVGTRPALPVPSLLPVGPAEAPSERRDDQLRRSRLTVALWRKRDRARLRKSAGVGSVWDRPAAAGVWSQCRAARGRGDVFLVSLLEAREHAHTEAHPAPHRDASSAHRSSAAEPEAAIPTASCETLRLGLTRT